MDKITDRHWKIRDVRLKDCVTLAKTLPDQSYSNEIIKEVTYYHQPNYVCNIAPFTYYSRLTNGR